MSRLDIQGDQAAWAKHPVDFKTKVPLGPGHGKAELLFGSQQDVWLKLLVHPVLAFNYKVTESYLGAPALDHAAEEAAATGGGLPASAATLTGTLARHFHSLNISGYWDHHLGSRHFTHVSLVFLFFFFHLRLFHLWSDCLFSHKTIGSILNYVRLKLLEVLKFRISRGGGSR